ncbi:6609_t:CDS:2, partial [Gigaspora margarita]
MQTDEKNYTLLETNKLPEEEMTAEPLNSLKDKLSVIYRKAEKNKKLQTKPDGDK